MDGVIKESNHMKSYLKVGTKKDIPKSSCSVRELKVPE